ncbi:MULTISPECIES: DUF2800 domain-containing protein [Helcococcus]|uniref:DUF2800 domain-containing protein n=1 Tax=Helcococcus bovis TaxID=3153252 RepID=A0ABW9F636_9FIRM
MNKTQEHALLSASSSHRWLNCTPSAKLEESFENVASESAKEGTAAHALCEYKLKRSLGLNEKRPVSDYNSDEMEEYTDDYVQFVLEELSIAKEYCNDPLLLIEQRLDFLNYVPSGFGTGDAVIVSDDRLNIIDFKYGMGILVDANNNPQMKLYALGALNLFESIYDIKNIKMTIFQPRRENISSFEISVDELKEWAEGELKEKAKLAYKGEGEFKCGDWCRFCRASATCRKRAEEKLKLAKFEFKKTPLLTDDEIEEILKVIPDLTKWADEVLAYATYMAVNKGKTWSGFKIVEGRSNRKFSDVKKVEELLLNEGVKDIYKTSLVTLTELEKRLGKQKFNELLSELVIKPKGKSSLVPLSDKRKEIKVETVEQEFNKKEI